MIESLNRKQQEIPGALPAVLFLCLSFGDMFFSLHAFSLGYAEGNPFMAYLLERGLFMPGKALLSVVLAGLMLVILKATKRYTGVVWGGVVFMLGVNAFHMASLSRHL